MAIDVTISRKVVNDQYYSPLPAAAYSYAATDTSIIRNDIVTSSTPGQSTLPHTEVGRLINLTAHLVQIEFDFDFDVGKPPIQIELDVYKMEPYSGGYKRKDILWTYIDDAQPRIDGADITIDARQTDLTGVIIEYKYEEYELEEES